MDRTAFEEVLSLERLVEYEAEQRLRNVMHCFVETMRSHGAPGSHLPLDIQHRLFSANTDIHGGEV